MAYWLFKSEPGAWSWENQKAKGDAGEQWDSVRNYQARNFMRDMKIGDRGFFYHSVDEKRIVGIVEIIAQSHPDSTDSTGKWECVDIRAVADMPEPVSLDRIKVDERLADMVLVKNSRLSVQPVTAKEWKIICNLGRFS